MEEINGLINFVIILVVIMAIIFAAIAVLSLNTGNLKIFNMAYKKALLMIVIIIISLMLKPMAKIIYSTSVGGFKEWGEQNIKNTSAKRETVENEKPKNKYMEYRKKEYTEIQVNVQADKQEEPKKESEYIYYQKEDKKGRNRITVKESGK